MQVNECLDTSRRGCLLAKTKPWNGAGDLIPRVPVEYETEWPVLGAVQRVVHKWVGYSSMWDAGILLQYVRQR